MTQCEQILAYMVNHDAITPLQAMRDLGCYRLSARIWDLRREGHQIVVDMIDVQNRWDQTTQVAQYRLAQEPKQMELGL